MAAKQTVSLSVLQQTLGYLFDEQPHVLAQPVEYWMATSKPFAHFAQTYQQKIRKKVRTAQSGEERYNLYCELRTAYLLLQEPRFAVEYELLGKQYGRCPDFTVTYRTHTAFQVEVTRLRLSQQEREHAARDADAGARLEANEPPSSSADLMRQHESRRVAHVVCDKLGQFLAGTPNVLLLWVQSQAAYEIDIAQLMMTLKQRAEQRDQALLAHYGLRNPADFMRGYQRLSAIFLQRPHALAGRQAPQVWHNRDAKHPLPASIQRALHALIAADDSIGLSGDVPPDQFSGNVPPDQFSGDISPGE